MSDEFGHVPIEPPGIRSSYPPTLIEIRNAIVPLSRQIANVGGLLGGALQRLQNDVDEIPRESPPDPRIDTLIEAMGALIDALHASVEAQSAMLAKLDSLCGHK